MIRCEVVTSRGWCRRASVGRLRTAQGGISASSSHQKRQVVRVQLQVLTKHWASIGHLLANYQAPQPRLGPLFCSVAELRTVRCSDCQSPSPQAALFFLPSTPPLATEIGLMQLLAFTFALAGMMYGAGAAGNLPVDKIRGVNLGACAIVVAA